MNKVVYVKAKFKPVGRYQAANLPTGKTRKAFFGLAGKEVPICEPGQKWVQTGESKMEIDGELLAQEIELTVAALNQKGYEVVSMSEIISGKSINSISRTNGYGYSVTEGVIIIARQTQPISQT